FGQVIIGQTNSQVFQVINTGGLTLNGTVSTTPPFYIQSGNPFSVSSGQTGLVTVIFNPTNAASFNNSVVFLSNGGTSTNPVSGTGIIPAQLGIVPVSLNFGLLPVGSSTQANFVITNRGATVLSNGTATVDGGPFTIVSGTPFTVPPAGFTNLVVTFSPSSSGSFSTVVLLSSTARKR